MHCIVKFMLGIRESGLWDQEEPQGPGSLEGPAPGSRPGAWELEGGLGECGSRPGHLPSLSREARHPPPQRAQALRLHSSPPSFSAFHFFPPLSNQFPNSTQRRCVIQPFSVSVGGQGSHLRPPYKLLLPWVRSNQPWPHGTEHGYCYSTSTKGLKDRDIIPR